MKQFEKWWKDNSEFSGATIGDAEAIWQAALEWVQLRLKFGSQVAYSSDDILMVIKKEIREELENGDS